MPGYKTEDRSFGSREAAHAAIRIAISNNREEERQIKQELASKGIRIAAMDFGGEAVNTIPKIIERAVVGAKREGVIHDCHSEEGAVVGATHEVLSQVMIRTVGFNVGGKIGVARYRQHLCVAVFFAIGMIHLDDVAFGLAHRAVEDF